MYRTGRGTTSLLIASAASEAINSPPGTSLQAAGGARLPAGLGEALLALFSHHQLPWSC